MARSERNKVGNSVFPELDMTSYPKLKDGVTTDAGASVKANPNLKGWTNVGDGPIPDYVMAEHVNALIDGMMAIQWTLGHDVMLPADTTGMSTEEIENLRRTRTVRARIDDLEGQNFDERYGGPGWTVGPDRTIARHFHTGAVGSPSKIMLTGSAEVQGKLEKVNLNLTSATGVTGDDIFLATGGTESIKSSIQDKLSKTSGGIVKGKVDVQASLDYRLQKEMDQSLIGGTSQSDAQTLAGTRKEFTGTDMGTFLDIKVSNLQYGMYVLGVRTKLVAGSLDNGNALEMEKVAQAGETQQIATVTGADYRTVGKWRMMYLVFEHEPTTSTKEAHIRIRKTSSSSAKTVAVDHAYITPAHPAIFDK